MESKNNWKAWLYLAPVIILMAVFTFYPILNSFYISFLDNYDYVHNTFDGFTFNNYISILTPFLNDPELGNTGTMFESVVQIGLPNTMLLTIITVPLSIIISLAIAIGTSHGAYKFKGEAKLRFDILAKVKEKIPNTPIVLHGASTVVPELVEICNKYGANLPGAKGVPDEMLHEASISGVSKVNVDTDLRLAMTAGIRETFVQDPSIFDPRKYLGKGRELIEETVAHKIRDVFGSSNKA